MCIMLSLRCNPEIWQNVQGRGINGSQLKSTSSWPHGQVLTRTSPLGGRLSCDQAPERREEPEKKKERAGSWKAIKKEQRAGSWKAKKTKAALRQYFAVSAEPPGNSSIDSNLLKFTNSVI